MNLQCSRGWSIPENQIKEKDMIADVEQPLERKSKQVGRYETAGIFLEWVTEA